MIERPQLPEWLDADVLAAFTRITERLWLRGEWRPEFIFMAEIAADACATYASAVFAEGLSAADVEEDKRRAARLLRCAGYLTTVRT